MFYNATKVVPMTVVGKWYTFQGKTARKGKDGMTPITLGWVFGKPIPIKRMDPKTTDPAVFASYLDDVHEQYTTAIGELFHKYKSRFR